jgi:hypothetical protein
MTNNPAALRSLVVYAVILPLAIILGYLLTSPLDKPTVIALVIFATLLLLPLLLRWYHTWMIVFWNMSITFIYMPGLLPAWMPLACIGFVIAIGHYILNRERHFLSASSVSISLICLGLVVAITAKFRGGLGFNTLGDESIGGKRYLFLWVAIIGYFVLISQPIAPRKRKLYTTLFLLGGVTAVMSELGSHLGPLANLLNIFFPGTVADNTGPTAPMGFENLERFGGLAAAALAILFVLMARYGIEGILNMRKIWRLIFFVLGIVATAFGGYRGMIVMLGLTLIFLFCFEGLLRSRLMPVAVLGIIFVVAIVICFSDQFPLPVQRCLAIFPVKISYVARISAESSSTWRIDMWQGLLPQIPHYLLFGKGLTFDANDMAMYAMLGNQQVMGQAGGALALAGDYHNGPLSVIIPFGIWGVITFLWFLWASIKVLWANFRYGDPELHKTNTFLLSYFLAKSVFFLFVFGGFYSDLFVFTGLIGFSISLNGGVARRVLKEERPPVVFNRFRPLPMGKPVAST